MNVTPAAGRRGFVGRRSAGATVLETALVCGVLLGLLALVGPLLSPPMLQRGYLNAVPIAVFWGALRLAVPEGSWRRRLVREVVVGAVVPGTGWGLMMALARYVATYGEPPSLASADVYLAVYAVSVLIYGAVRVAVRLWLFWDRLRRRHMVWSLTHALLATALVAVSPVVVVGVAGYALSLAEGTPSSIGGLASLLASMVIWGAPLAGAVLVVGVMGLLGLAPVLAVPAYVVARRTTRRLEALARVARISVVATSRRVWMCGGKMRSPSCSAMSTPWLRTFSARWTSSPPNATAWRGCLRRAASSWRGCLMSCARP